MYNALALLQPDSDLTLANLAKTLKAKFPDIDVQESKDEVTLSKGDWDYHLAWQSGPDVLNESEGLAGRIVGLDEDTPMRLCDRRVQMWSDTPDPFLEYMDSHFQVIDALRGFKGIILVDPNEPAVL